MPLRTQHLPKSDWSCREILDALSIDPDAKSKCDFCGTQIRWVHILEHDDCDHSVTAGCCCAAKFCFNYDARSAEREYKNRSTRRMRFVELQRWKRSRNNPANICRKVTTDVGLVTVTIFLQEGQYGICLAYKKKMGQQPRYHWAKFASQAEAMHTAFELIDEQNNRA